MITRHVLYNENAPKDFNTPSPICTAVRVEPPAVPSTLYPTPHMSGKDVNDWFGWIHPYLESNSRDPSCVLGHCGYWSEKTDAPTRRGIEMTLKINILVVDHLRERRIESRIAERKTPVGQWLTTLTTTWQYCVICTRPVKRMHFIVVSVAEIVTTSVSPVRPSLVDKLKG